MTPEPSATAAGTRHVAHETLGSTNAEALRLARQGERGPLWVSAARQTAGHGRRGRPWISQPGNLFASLLLTDPAPAEHWPQLAFVAALATHDAIAEVAAPLAPLLAIKWPNDLMLARAKVAGILIEGDSGGRSALAIGIGVNCASHPGQLEQPATDLATAGAPVSPATLFGVLTDRMRARIAQWNAGAGFPAIRLDWLARAVGVGESVCARLGDREIVGRFEALDATGGLVLRLPDGTASIVSTGDVFVLAAPASRRAG
ncbi:MAG TPA: biotin--[acetyl-CoA-carboxylase] ligase [Xanthobacteraceae bacterium]|jgi:BirA family biotin operon repressor/biotin-[acetyl-CoA-carboxylase] ligase